MRVIVSAACFLGISAQLSWHGFELVAHTGAHSLVDCPCLAASESLHFRWNLMASAQVFIDMHRFVICSFSPSSGSMPPVHHQELAAAHDIIYFCCFHGRHPSISSLFASAQISVALRPTTHICKPRWHSSGHGSSSEVIAFQSWTRNMNTNRAG